MLCHHQQMDMVAHQHIGILLFIVCLAAHELEVSPIDSRKYQTFALYPAGPGDFQLSVKGLKFPGFHYATMRNSASIFVCSI